TIVVGIIFFLFGAGMTTGCRDALLVWIPSLTAPMYHCSWLGFVSVAPSTRCPNLARLNMCCASFSPGFAADSIVYCNDRQHYVVYGTIGTSGSASDCH